MNNEIQIVESNCVHPRLTITPSRSTLKFPIGYEETHGATFVDRVVLFAQLVVLNHLDVDKSYRGRIKLHNGTLKIAMQTDSGNDTFFECEK